jgi:hypothetical protein
VVLDQVHRGHLAPAYRRRLGHGGQLVQFPHPATVSGRPAPVTAVAAAGRMAA